MSRVQSLPMADQQSLVPTQLRLTVLQGGNKSVPTIYSFLQASLACAYCPGQKTWTKQFTSETLKKQSSTARYYLK